MSFDPHREYSIVKKDDAYRVIASYLLMYANDKSPDSRLTKRQETALLFALVGEYCYDDLTLAVVSDKLNGLLWHCLPRGLMVEVRTISWHSKDDGGTDAEFWLVHMPDPDLD